VQSYAFNVTGHPAISVPVGLSPKGLPLAVQVVGRYFDEARILQVARAIERLTGWENQLLPEPI
jgi:aspartyl-tRNA(Asn)/glutamyl-tRNA(Gln) amidotransferase subunit A